jgi:hypothetical protein
MFFIRGKGSERPTAQLLFIPAEVLTVRSATRETVFEPGKDFEGSVQDRKLGH